mgnify:CR=1 FL=1
MKHGPYPYERMRSYPHLSLEDTVIWDRFIVARPNAYDFVEYDVCVGDRREDDTELNEATNRNAEYLGKYKIDVIGVKDGRIDIIEIKPIANARALGQIIQYDYLYERDFAPTGETRSVIVCGEVPPNMQEIADEHTIILIVV